MLAHKVLDPAADEKGEEQGTGEESYALIPKVEHLLLVFCLDLPVRVRVRRRTSEQSERM